MKPANNATFEDCIIYWAVENSGKNTKFTKTIIGLKQKVKENYSKIIIASVIAGVVLLAIEYGVFNQ